MDPIIITVAARCGHTTEQPANPGAVAMLREVAGRYPCQSCKSNRVEPVRFAAGWGWRTGR